ncbi:MAG: hypothetical protein ACKOFH_09070, partial [Chthoniobacterales bacterium]
MALPTLRRSGLERRRSCAMRSGSISIGKDGFEVAVELLCGPFATGGLRFGMKSTGTGTEFGILKAVGTLRATKQESREISDFSPLCCRQCLAKLDDFHGFRAHKNSLAEKPVGAIRAASSR